MSDLPRGEHAVELGVALVDAGVHAAAQPGVAVLEAVDQRLRAQPGPAVAQVLEPQRLERDPVGVAVEREGLHDAARDRKSTRLNSSHVEISYAVFCLKKK